MTEDQPEEDKQSLVDRAEAAADRIEAGNKKTEELEVRKEENAARDKLGGRTDAGQTPPPPKEETNAEYVDRIRKDGKDVNAKKA